MIGTTKKPLEEVLQALEGYRKIAVVGCEICAKVCKTGGKEEVSAMADLLKEQGKEVLFQVAIEPACNALSAGHTFRPFRNQLNETEAVLVLGCGGAVQITRYLTEVYGLVVPVKTGLNTIGHVDTIIAGRLALEECQECGECILNETGAICPVTKCAKGLLEGPCGGAQNGKCEANREHDCAWILIYNRMKALGELDKLKRYLGPKDYSKAAKPRTLYLNEGRVA